MNCVNRNTAEFKKLLKESGLNPVVLSVKIGRFQSINGLDAFPALSDIMPEQKKGTKEPSGSVIDLMLEEYPQNVLNSVTSNNARAQEIASKLSEQLGVEYDIVTPEEAQAFTANTQNPWNGEPAFFLGNKVYFVGPYLFTSLVVHEFSHPLVRTIARTNKPLFDTLYNNIKDSQEGQALIQETIKLYPELKDQDILFREEVIVRALEKEAAGFFEQSTGFRKIIADVLYAIRQMLRRVFGQRADVSKMTPSTSLEDLAKMLAGGGNFTINTEVVDNDDITAYAREQKAEISDMMAVRNTDVQDLINSVYSTVSKHLTNLKTNKEYDELASILTDEFKRGDLEEIKGNLSKYQSVVGDMADKVKKDFDYRSKQATALVNTMYRLDTVMEKIFAHLQDISQNADEMNNLNRAYYYDHMIKQWQGFIQHATNVMNDSNNNIPNDSPLIPLIASIKRSADRSKNIINDIYANGARETLYAELEPMGTDIKKRYDTIVANLKKRNAPQREIDKWHKEFYGLTEAEYRRFNELESRKNTLSYDEQREHNRLKTENAKGLEISKAKIESLLKGEAGDANYFNSYLEGYLYNTDPIIGGLALYVKNKMNEVMAVTQAKYNQFASDMKPLLDKAGYNPTNIGGLGKRIGFLDTAGFINEKGELEERKVWTLMSQFKDYRYAVQKLDHAVEVAQTAWNQSGSDVDRAALVKAISDRKKHMRQWFHQKYDSRYYEREALFESDDIGVEAAYRRDKILEDIKLLTASAKTQTEQLEINDALDKLWSDYKQLTSLYNLDGTKKQGLELEIAQRLIAYRDASREFHTFVERPGVFQNALEAYEQELINAGTPVGSPEFNTLRNEWIQSNTRIRIKESFYTRRQEILDEVKEIMSKIPGRDQIDMSQNWEEILDLSAGFRDEDGQLKATEMSPATVSDIKALQEDILQKRKNFRGRSGLTPAESDRLSKLRSLEEEVGLTDEEQDEMDNLFSTMESFGLSKLQKKRLDTLYAELEELSRTEPTEYYVHTINNWLQELNTDGMDHTMGSRMITIGTANKFLNPEILEGLFAQSEAFETWFKANHLQREVYNKDLQKMELRWERLYIWNLIKPNDPAYMETTVIKDAEGNVTETIEGLPATKYYARVVLPEFETKQVVGVTVDNRGNWLPKNVLNSPYINEAYNRLSPTDKAVLDKIAEHHLRNQEGLDRKSRLYLDFPRFRKSNLEVLQTQNVAKENWNALTIWAKRTREFFTGAKDDAQSGFNEKDEFNMVKVDIFDNDVTRVPIAGLYDISPDDVSTDITSSVMRYMLSAERQKQLVKISPVARAIQAVVKDPRNTVELDKNLKRNFVTKTIQRFRGKKETSIREKAIDNFIEREFEGQNITGHTKDIPWINNLQNVLFKRASFGFFALNIPSALKNTFGAKFQGMIEASAGTDLNHATFAQGEATSLKTMMEISAQVYHKGPKSLNVQLVELFDPSQGRFEEKFGESLSRTVTKDTASMSWLYNFRKWTELQATLQIFFGMMHHKRVDQLQLDGTTKKIDYVNAWEVKDGKIQLKDGVDPKWGITYDRSGNIQVGNEYKKIRNRTHQVMNNLQGAYSKFDQPEAQRYLAYRFLSYLRRYFTTMFTNRWGFSGKWYDPQPRINPGMGDVQMGFYITFLKTFKRTVMEMGRNLPYMTAEEKGAALKVLTEMGALVITTALLSLLFGWDPDDEERFEKLRQKSGALPFPFVADDPSRPFNGFGFMENHALFLLMNIRAENEQFLPFPGFGMDDYSAMLDMKSIAFGPTIQNYFQIVDDMVNIIQGDDAAYYQREVGPYEWQQQGGAKIWSHLARILGMSGSSLDPAKAVKGFVTSEALKK